MKIIKIGILETNYKNIFRNKYIPSIFNYSFNNINFIKIENPFKEECDICFYDLYSITYEDVKNNIFDQLKGNPILVLDKHCEHPSYPLKNNSIDTFKDWTNNFKNFSISIYNDSTTNLYFPYYIDFERIKNNINIRQKFDISIKNKFANWISSNPDKLRKNIIDYINNNYKHIDYYGNVYYNDNINDKSLKIQNDTAHWWDSNDIHTYYKFNFAFENTPTNKKNNVMYITEKINHGYCNNSIPIYWGCSNITDYFNENSFINLCNLTEDEMIEKIKLINENDEFYKDMFYAYPFKDKNVDYQKYFNDKYINFMTNIFNMI